MWFEVLNVTQIGLDVLKLEYRDSLLPDNGPVSFRNCLEFHPGDGLIVCLLPRERIKLFSTSTLLGPIHSNGSRRPAYTLQYGINVCCRRFPLWSLHQHHLCRKISSSHLQVRSKLVARENKRSSRLWVLGFKFRKFLGFLMTSTYPFFFFFLDILSSFLFQFVILRNLKVLKNGKNICISNVSQLPHFYLYLFHP